MASKKKVPAPVIAIAVALVAVLVTAGIITVTRNRNRPDDVVDAEQATKTLADLYDKVDPDTITPSKSAVDVSDTMSLAEELPDISTYSVSVEPTTDTYAEIWSSGEKAGEAGGTDGYLTDMATQFNSAGITVDGVPVSIRLRSVPSGTAIDYLQSGKETEDMQGGVTLPDGWTPSSQMQVLMANADGVPTETVTDRMVGNVAGMVIKNDKANELRDTYGSLDVGAVTEAVSAGTLQFGYTNPLTSAAGMNFLVATLNRYDPDNILSDTAAQGFRSFQANIPLIAVTTQQMRSAADRDSLDGFITERQVYETDATLKAGYTFVAFGQRHDNPLVTPSAANESRKGIVKAFADYCENNGASLASRDGFNTDDWQPEAAMPDGNTLVAAQSVYKENRSGGTTTVAVFVADTSGSMNAVVGDSGSTALGMLQDSLTNGMRYINQDTYVGLVSYSTRVHILVPPAAFDMSQRALFKGGVDSLQAAGETATYDAIIVAAKLAQDAASSIGDTARPMVIVLSDGDTNAGRVSFDKDLKPTISALSMPVYTIGYNANVDELKRISDMTEAASIDASSDDVMYQIKTLFNATM